MDPDSITEDIVDKALEPLLNKSGIELITDDPGDEPLSCVRTSNGVTAVKVKNDEWVIFQDGTSSFVKNDYVIGWESTGSVSQSAVQAEVQPTVDDYVAPDITFVAEPRYSTDLPEYDQIVYDVGGDPLSDTPYADTDYIELDAVWPEAYPRHFRHIYTNVRWRIVNGRIECFNRNKWEASAWDDIEAFLADKNIVEITE